MQIAVTGATEFLGRYIVARLLAARRAKRLSGSKSEIRGGQSSPKHQIATEKLRSLGMQFGGEPLLEQTIGQLLAAVR